MRSCLLLLLVACGSADDQARSPGEPGPAGAEAEPVATTEQPPSLSAPDDRLPACCRDYPELERLDGQRVRVTGRYERVVVAKRGRPEPDLDQPGPSSVVVDDGLEIMLGIYYAPEDNRPVEEARRFHGKQVVVTGTVHARTPPQPEAATMIGPYLGPVERIELAD